MTKDCDVSIEFYGDVLKALEAGKNKLTRMNMRVFPEEGNRLPFENPHRIWQERRSPLAGVSRGVVTVTDTTLTVEVEIGRVRTVVKIMACVMALFLVPMSVGLAYSLVVVENEPKLLPVCFAVYLPFVMFLTPLYYSRKLATNWAMKSLLNEIAESARKKVSHE